jgi:polyhydroxybutyrate depolymerase
LNYSSLSGRRSNASVASEARHIHGRWARTPLSGCRRWLGASAHRRSLLLAFHGSGGSAAQFRRFTGRGFDQWAEDGLGTVVYLDSWRKGLWNDARISTRSRAREEGVDDVAFVQAVIGHFQAGEKDVFAAGYSNGGQMVIRLLLDAPQLLSAAALIGATVPSPENLSSEGAALPVPMLLVHGAKDPLVPYDGGMASIFGFRTRGRMRSAPDSARYWAALNGVDAQPEVSMIPSGRAKPRTVTSLYAYGESSAAPVRFYSVEGGGHVVPNPRTRPNLLLGRSSTELDAPTVILDYFRTHALR